MKPTVFRAILSTLIFVGCSIAAQAQQLPTQALPETLTSSGPQGILAPWRTSRVACAESGLIDQIMVRPGDTVHVGQMLASLNLDQPRIMVATAQAQADAVGKIESAKAEVELQTRRVEAIAEGQSNGATSKSELERAQVELKIARGRLAAELEDLQIQKLHVQRLQKQLEQHTVVAPFDGTVVRLFKEIGEFVAPNSPEIVELVDISRLRAVFYLSLDELQVLIQSARPSIELDGKLLTDTEFEYIAPVADAESGLVEVRILVANPSKRIMGASCSLVIGGASKPTT